MSNRLDLATTVNITSTYAGEFAGKYISAALLTASTIENGGVTVMPNVKYKSVIQRIETGTLIADGTCDFTPISNVDLTEVIVMPEEFQVNLQLCKSDFLSTWQSYQMGFSAFNPNGLPTSFSEYLIGHVVAKVAAANESNIWTGNLGGAQAGEYNGIETLAAADATVIDVPAPVALTSVNIIDKLQAVVDLIPNALYSSETLKLYISNKAAKLYVRALGGFSVAATSNSGTDAKGTQWFSNGNLTFGGIPIFLASGMSDDTLLAAESTNLFFATGLLSDYNECRTIDMTPVDGSQNFRFILRFTAASAIGVGADVVYYAG